MCLAVPARVTEIQGEMAKVDILGNQIFADISALDGVSIGEYLLIHAGFAIRKYEPGEGEENLRLIQELLEKSAPEF